MRGVLSLLLIATTVMGCYSKNDADDASKVPLGAMPPAAVAAAPAEGLSGEVVETLAAPPYTYLRVKTSTGDVWAAVPEAKVANGAKVTVYNPMLMTKFESKTLKRTFDEVYFGTLDAGPGPEAAAMGATGTSPHTGAPVGAVVEVGKVAKATGPDARTVGEAWAQMATLGGKTVTISGKVVKFNGQVMGKNWIHLQDGSGDAAKGTNDITVTSMDETAVGQTITITGTVRTNKDFGAGYKYAIIVEDAKIAKKS